MTTRAPSRRPLVTAPDIVDVFVYVVVLNLYIEYLPAIVTETFTLSLLTAVLLKVVLEAVVWAKGRVLRRFAAAETATAKVVAGVLLWGLAFGSKFLVLELVALLFADSVRLGGFFAVTALVLSLLLARAGVRRLLAAEPAADLG
ncbi:MAG: hypothetical protein AAGC63_11305 [Propionicimonas sp.]